MRVPSSEDLYLFYQGEQMNAHLFLGCHPDDKGYSFSLWAPNAKAVSVVGDFNGWDINNAPMERMDDEIWHAHLPDIRLGERYKYAITAKDGRVLYKQDPYAFKHELRPGTCSLVWDMPAYAFTDEGYMHSRGEHDPLKKPMSIYEVHLPSWRGGEDDPFGFKRAIEELIPYVVDMGFTHIELMPVTEYPLDASWGYQVTGFFAVTGRLGDPCELAEFVDECHKAGIGVILDFVMGHFPKDEFSLYRFDGIALYEHEDPRQGEHKEWGTCIFNYGRGAVRSFLLSCANYYISAFHIDGLRLDAVSSMLYLDYGKEDGEWVANSYGGNENLDAIDFIKQFNKSLQQRHYSVLTFAEEAITYPMVTQPPPKGLGFNFKWNMGWMNDILSYVKIDPLFRKGSHNKLTFSLTYAFTENYVLPLSHDEVVHGKCSLLSKMPGYYDDKFAQLRLLLSYMWAHPGKKLLFMGGEFGQFIEWRFYEQLDWLLLEYDRHKEMQGFTRALNRYYTASPALYKRDDSWDGFEWSVVSDSDQSVLAFVRTAQTDTGGIQRVLCVFNFTPLERRGYGVGVPKMGMYTLKLNSDEEAFGGKARGVAQRADARKCPSGEFEQQILIDIPPYGALFYEIAE